MPIRFEWSPDSQSLAVVHTVTGKRVLSIVDVKNGTLRTLDVGGRPIDNAVYWRPGTTSEIDLHQPLPTGQFGSGGHLLDQGRGREADCPSCRWSSALAEYNGVDLAPDGRTLTYWRWGSVADAVSRIPAPVRQGPAVGRQIDAVVFGRADDRRHDEQSASRPRP